MSADGHVLVYQAGGSDSRLRVLDRAGHAAPDELPTGVFESPALSRDGQRLAIVKTDPVTSAANVAILDVGRKAMTRLTNGATRDTDPVWSPSGDQLAYTSLQSDGRKHFYIMPSAGGAAREFKPPELSRGGLDDWSRDGRWILYHDTGNRLMALDITRASEPVVVAVSSGARQPDQGAFSPTGEAVAFDSFESTSAGSEVYVVPFPATGARWQVSTAGGVQPQWREDGKEMFFLAPDGTMMAVDILGFGPNFKAGVPHALFKTQVVPVFQQSQYVVSADGSRFILVEPNGRDGNQALRVITDWPAALNGAGNN
jgi:Tol biopolymer transport system component